MKDFECQSDLLLDKLIEETGIDKKNFDLFMELFSYLHDLENKVRMYKLYIKRNKEKLK